MQDVVLRQAPRLGEHTREICQNLLRLDDAEIERLVAEGALEVPRRGGVSRTSASFRLFPGRAASNVLVTSPRMPPNQ